MQETFVTCKQLKTASYFDLIDLRFLHNRNQAHFPTTVATVGLCIPSFVRLCVREITKKYGQIFTKLLRKVSGKCTVSAA